MKKDLDHYLKRKQQRRRILQIVVIAMIAAFCTVLMQECSQSFNEPYNKDYQPVDQTSLPAHGDFS